MFLQRADDNTGKIEEIVDEKLTTSGFVNADTVTEMIAAAQLEPVAPDVYLTKSEAASTYSTFSAVNNAVQPVSDAVSALTSSVHTIDGKFKDYATTKWVTSQLDSIDYPDNIAAKTITAEAATIGNMYTKQQIDALISAGSGGTFDPSIFEDYATIEYVDNAVENATIPDVIHKSLTVDGNFNVTGKFSNNGAEFVSPGMSTSTFAISGDRFWTCDKYEQNMSIHKSLSMTGNLDVSGYTTIGGNLSAPNIYTKTEVDALISASSGGGDVTKAYVDEQISTHKHNNVYYTKAEVDTKIAEIPSGGGKIEVIDNDLTVNGNLTTTGLFNTRLETWQEYDDYVNRYPSGTFPIDFQKHDDTSKMTKTFPKNIVKTIYPGHQIVGEWKIEVFLDSEGDKKQAFRSNR